MLFNTAGDIVQSLCLTQSFSIHLPLTLKNWLSCLTSLSALPSSCGQYRYLQPLLALCLEILSTQRNQLGGRHTISFLTIRSSLQYHFSPALFISLQQHVSISSRARCHRGSRETQGTPRGALPRSTTVTMKGTPDKVRLSTEATLARECRL